MSTKYMWASVRFGDLDIFGQSERRPMHKSWCLFYIWFRGHQLDDLGRESRLQNCNLIHSGLILGMNTERYWTISGIPNL